MASNNNDSVWVIWPDPLTGETIKLKEHDGELAVWQRWKEFYTGEIEWRPIIETFREQGRTWWDEWCSIIKNDVRHKP